MWIALLLGQLCCCWGRRPRSIATALSTFDNAFSTCSGPKSGVRRARLGPRRIFKIWAYIVLYFYMIGKADGVKVGCGSALHPGAEVPSAKPSGGTTMDFSKAVGGNFAKQLVRKRAYHRALIRAQQNGTTMYRGRCVTAQQAAWYQAPTLIKANRNVPGRQASRWRSGRVPRLRVCSQNLGGFCAATYDGFCNWLKDCPYDLVLVQETHFGLGRDSTQWSSEHWHTVLSIDSGARFFWSGGLYQNIVCA